MSHPGTVPIRRPQLSHMPEEPSLPGISVPRKLVRRKELASYDVKLIPHGGEDAFMNATAGRESAMSGTNRSCSIISGRQRHGHMYPASNATPMPPTTPLRPRPPGSPLNVAQFPHQGPPSLLSEMELYIQDEMKIVQDEAGRVPKAGTEPRYRVFRNALSFFASHVKSYEGVLSSIVKEFDMCFDKILEKAGESERLRQQVLEERQLRDQAIADMEGTHKAEVASILKEVHQTKLDNLLSVEMGRLRDRIKELEAEVEHCRWENAEVLDANRALVELKNKVVAEQHAKHKLEGPEQHIPEEMDHLVATMSSSLFASFRVINHLKAREVRVENARSTIEQLEQRVEKTTTALNTTSTQQKLLEDELQTVTAAHKKLQAEHKELLATKEVESDSSTKKRLRADIEFLKEQLASNKAYYKQKLFELHKQIVTMERMANDVTLKHCHHLVGRAVVPHGSGGRVRKMLRAPLMDLVPNAGYTPKMVVGEVDGIIQLLQAQVRGAKEQSMLDLRDQTAEALPLSPGTSPRTPHMKPITRQKNIDFEGLILNHFAKYGVHGNEAPCSPGMKAKSPLSPPARSAASPKPKKAGKGKGKGKPAKDASPPPPPPEVADLAGLSSKAQQRLLSFINALHHYYRHADCELMLSVLDGKLSHVLWDGMNAQAAAVKAKLKELARQSVPPSKRDIVHLICTSCMDGKTLENALSIFMAICPMGVVANNFSEFIADASFGITELVKVQYIEEAKLFILQIEEGVRGTPQRGMPLTKRALLSVIFEADPHQDPLDIVTLVESGLEAELGAAPDDTTELPPEHIESYLSRLVASYPWHKRSPLFTEGMLQEAVSIDMGMTAKIADVPPDDSPRG
eukprot:TRINITY_DN24714_c0_g1_i1.p1 TRINITY_DN24714_c0_g1~~TRINITY_DN24714_c0_g1_i1.p1  ORF type:complete len:858 (+),score=223.64 TRINITY_DN24714_c0_g1_i1:89-2662(+)